MAKDTKANSLDTTNTVNLGQNLEPKKDTQAFVDQYQEVKPQINMGQHQSHPYEASIPHHDLADQTEGFQPRSREPFTRAADERTQKFIDYYQNASMQMHKGKTHMPKEWVPEGYVFMWARESCRGRPDHNNLQELENLHGWEYMNSSMCPQFAYYDDAGVVDDSSTKVRRGGLIGMIRREEIHNAQLRQLERLRKSDNRMSQVMRTVDGDLHPFSNHSTDANNAFFPSDDMANSFSSSFSY